MTAAADAAFAALLPSLNERRFQKLDGSRVSLFAAVDAPTLSALPAQHWQWATFKTVKKIAPVHSDVVACVTVIRLLMARTQKPGR